MEPPPMPLETVVGEEAMRLHIRDTLSKMH
jgi:hypothetical protein